MLDLQLNVGNRVMRSATVYLGFGVKARRDVVDIEILRVTVGG